MDYSYVSTKSKVIYICFALIYLCAYSCVFPFASIVRLSISLLDEFSLRLNFVFSWQHLKLSMFT